MEIIKQAIQNKYDFFFMFDGRNCNPNGEPDAGNAPRIDPETGLCLVTDVCLKRKIRNYVALVREGVPGFKMYIQPQSGQTLNARDMESFVAATGCTTGSIAEYKKGHPEVDDVLRNFMCENYYDIRTFGGVMTKFQSANLNCGTIRGPVQISMAESVSPVELRELSITRTAVATEDEIKKKEGTFAQKPIIPYGLFVCTGSVSPTLAQKYTGFSEEDLNLLWDAIMNMFDFDKSACRAEMATRKLVIFKHDNIYGNAPSHKLYERVHVKEVNPGKPIRSFSDYEVTVNDTDLPAGVSIEVRE